MAKVDDILLSAGLIGLFDDTPAYLRLEPQSAAGNPEPGLAAAWHDPLWSLLRQRQFAEFRGVDGGRALSVGLQWQSTALTAFRAGEVSKGTQTAIALPPGTPLDPLVETGGLAGTVSPRARAEAGRVLVVAMTEAGTDAAAALRAACAFTAVAGADPVLQLLLRSNPDGEAAAKALEAAVKPGWYLTATAAARAAADSWQSWYRTNVAPPATATSWVRRRVEYRFALGAGSTSYAATEHSGGPIDWWSLDAAPGVVLSGVPAAAPVPGAATMLAQPARFRGMPADRYWEFEDAELNLNMVDVQAADLARNLLIEYATVFGNDWFIAPLPAPAAASIQITRLEVTDSFGVTTPINRVTARPKAGPFQLFETSGSSGGALLTVPTVRITMDGTPVERVSLLRDEAANMGWAVEDSVADAWGRAASRRDEVKSSAQAPRLAGSDYVYDLAPVVPDHWMPLVPLGDGAGGFVLRRGSFTDQDGARGRILAGLPCDFEDAELPRGGLELTRVPSVVRDGKDRLKRWMAVRVRAATPRTAPDATYDKVDR